jgi:hypothetical protein
MSMTPCAFLLTALAGASACGAEVSIQVVNPDPSAPLRVFLDRQLIHEGAPSPVGAQLAGRFELDPRARHVLVAEVPATHTKAQFEWTPQTESGGWVVIHYYPGRREPGEPPFLSFSLQGAAYKFK